MNCRFCNNKKLDIFIDLGFAPPSNSYLTFEDLSYPEKFFPLKTNICSTCWLVQTQDFTKADDLFNPEYAYLSSASASWLAHARDFSDYIVEKNNLRSDNLVVEIACNDGYLLKNFKEKKIPCIGIEPTLSTAAYAKKLGIDVIEEFFGESFSKKFLSRNKKADLVIGNNVFAHVPNINDFTKGLKLILNNEGTICLEFPHLLNLIKLNQFDTIYHEHFSYLSLITTQKIFNKHGLKIYDVELLSTHGGSLRIYGTHKSSKKTISKNVSDLIKIEEDYGLNNINTYSKSQEKAEKIRNKLIHFLISEKMENRKVVCYGAAAKGNTLLNFAGIKKNLIEYVCDKAETKQNKYLPGSHIPIKSEKELLNDPPDTIIILPWNLKEEITNFLKTLIKKETKVVTFIPEFEYFFLN